MIFAKSSCRAIRPLSRSRGGVGAARAFSAVRFSKRQRAILHFATVMCILPRDWGVVLLDESNRAPALLSIPPLNFADLLLLPARSNIYARKCSDYTTIAHRRIIKSRPRVPAGREILIDGGHANRRRLTLINSANRFC